MGGYNPSLACQLKCRIRKRQCLLHRPGFQHPIAAALAAVVLFCCSIYYLSSWDRCPNPNSNNKMLEKKKELVAFQLSSAIFGKRVQRDSIPQPSALQPSALTTGLRIQSVKVLYLNRINEKNTILIGCRCTSDLTSETGPVQ